MHIIDKGNIVIDENTDCNVVELLKREHYLHLQTLKTINTIIKTE